MIDLLKNEHVSSLAISTALFDSNWDCSLYSTQRRTVTSRE